MCNLVNLWTSCKLGTYLVLVLSRCAYHTVVHHLPTKTIEFKKDQMDIVLKEKCKLEKHQRREIDKIKQIKTRR